MQIDVEPGTNKMRFTSVYSGTVRMSLTDPNGTTYGPDGAGAIVGYAVNNNSEVYELTNLLSGTWTIELLPISPAEGVGCQARTAILKKKVTVNIAPIANAGGPYSVEIGETLTFNGIESYDADGSIVLYEWDFESDGTIDYRSTETYAVYLYPTGFTGEVTLQITDSSGVTDSITSSVTVQQTIYMPIIIDRIEYGIDACPNQ